MQTKSSELIVNGNLKEQEVKELFANVNGNMTLNCSQDVDLVTLKLILDYFHTLQTTTENITPTKIIVNYTGEVLKNFTRMLSKHVGIENKILSATFLPGENMGEEEKKTLNALNAALRAYTTALASMFVNQPNRDKSIQVAQLIAVDKSSQKKRKIPHTDKESAYVKKLVTDNNNLKREWNDAAKYIELLEKKVAEHEATIRQLRSRETQIVSNKLPFFRTNQHISTDVIIPTAQYTRVFDLTIAENKFPPTTSENESTPEEINTTSDLDLPNPWK